MRFNLSLIKLFRYGEKTLKFNTGDVGMSQPDLTRILNRQFNCHCSYYSLDHSIQYYHFENKSEASLMQYSFKLLQVEKRLSS